MQTENYTQHPEIQEIVHKYRTFATQSPQGLQISGIRDAAGNQYVDLVMEGGGTLGVSLLGYIYILEQLDIRFLQIAGTSAGSIVAMLLAGGGPIAQAKSEWLIEKVAGKDFYEFVDGDEQVRDFVDTLMNPDARKGKKALTTTKVLDDLKSHYGLCPGDTFSIWMAELLAERGVRSLADLRMIRKIAPAGIHYSQTGDPCLSNRWERISVVTADITTGTKAALPDMATLYWADPESVNPGLFARASMSVAVFFYPFVAGDIPNTPEAADNWNRMANYRGPIPPEVLFVDGGSMSNFPMSLLFDENRNNEAPVFGVKMGSDRDSYTNCDSFGAFAGAMLSAMMSFYDNDFMMQHPEMKNQVAVIDTGNYNWLDFSLSDEAKLDLFVRGARAAAAFLDSLIQETR